ncbi:MAG: DUF5060 domain-containing protein, partial [Spirochaetaceae bacterium]
MINKPWQEIEFPLTAQKTYDNPYVDLEVWAEFRHESGKMIRRPAFWDGGQAWRVRFVSPGLTGTWTWTSFSNPADAGVNGITGEFSVDAADMAADMAAGDTAENRFYRHG